jgi:NAD(P)-dependent dehydrogenase (short-subunit alcohol dehydrogenase family)
VTGGANGIGYGISRALLEAGAKLAIADLDEQKLSHSTKTLAAEFPRSKVVAVKLDVSDPHQWQVALDDVEQRLGTVQVLCNNAGVAQGRVPMDALPVSTWDFIIKVNLSGVFYGINACVPRLKRARRPGHIVNTASIYGLIDAAGTGAYSASKFGVVSLSETLRAELMPHNIGVSVLCPGLVASDMRRTTLERFKEAGDLPTAFKAGEGQKGVDPNFEKMSPLSVGRRVVKAIRNNDLHIITHPEYAPLIQARFDAITSAIGESAQPDYRDPPGFIEQGINPAFKQR